MRNFLVLGGGSAGLIAAMTVKRILPDVTVRVVRSPEIGVIGVGEATTPNFPFHIFQYLGINHRRFYSLVKPTWKMGIHFIWGPRTAFDYTFEMQLDVRFPELARPNGFYCDDDFTNISLQNAILAQKKCFARQPNGGGPVIPAGHALHLENVRLVAGLEVFAREMGVEIIDGKVQMAERGPQGIAAIVLDDGRRMEADFFIDASGFRSELLGKTLEEPFINYGDSLFNDRAITGSWVREEDETILPYTTAETMDAGWAWRIDHEDVINRGYVHSSSSISDEQAREEFARKNPKIKIDDRIIKFRSGRYRRGWVDNVMAIGNACGFVEPLESSALMVVCWQMQTFVELVRFVGPTPSVKDLFNKVWGATWDEIRDFLTLHFAFNTRLDTPYWQHCRNDADHAGLTPLLEFYQENGPTGYARTYLQNTGSQFGIEGFLVLLVGQKVPYKNRYQAPEAEQAFINQHRAEYQAAALNGLDVKEALAYIRHPQWRWFAET